MLAAASLLILVLLALLVMRVATTVLTLTGLSREAARFQVRSALTGVGFTTSETEAVVNHPARRRVVMLLVLVGSAGVITAATTLVVSFARTDREGALLRILVLVAGLVALLFLARSKAFDPAPPAADLARARALHRPRRAGLRGAAAHLGRIHGGRAARRAGRLGREPAVGGARPARRGAAGARDRPADGEYLGAPAGSTVVEAGDTLVLYGRAEDVAELDEGKAGPSGDEEHRRAVAEGLKV